MATEADEEVFGARQMGGFKDFYQYVWQTRVVAGRGLLDSVGFEFMKEGAQRVFVVTDAVIRDSGWRYWYWTIVFAFWNLGASSSSSARSSNSLPMVA